MVDNVELSVIIVSWNVRELLLDCVRSLYTYNDNSAMETFVVDNCSSDGSVEYLKREFPQVTFVENRQNVGFARANNQGIRQARGRYILLLNPDTLWVDASLPHMVAFMSNHCEVGVVGPKLLNLDRKTIQYECARRLPYPMDTFFEYAKLRAMFPRCRFLGRHLMTEWNHADSREVECLSGACLLIRRDTLDEVGLLDDGYPLYSEDTDWCHRVSLTRWKLFYLAEARLIHIGHQSSVKNRGLATVMAVQGLYRYHRKFHGAKGMLAVWFLIGITSFAKLLAWTVLFLVKAGSRQIAIGQMRAYWKICCLRLHLFERQG